MHVYSDGVPGTKLRRTGYKKNYCNFDNSVHSPWVRMIMSSVPSLAVTGDQIMQSGQSFGKMRLLKRGTTTDT